MSTRLFVGNLPYTASEEEVRTALTSPDISIRSVRLAVDRETGRGRGFGFVEVGSPEEADRAIQQWTGRLIGGRAIAIDKAHDRRPGGSSPSGDRPPGPPRRPPMGGGGMSSRYAPPPPLPDEPARPDRADFIAPIDRDEGEGRRRGPGKGPAGKSAQGKKKAATGREAPKERGGKWRYDPKDDY
jgi:RNA recognition motif-containing protein